MPKHGVSKNHLLYNNFHNIPSVNFFAVNITRMYIGTFLVSWYRYLLKSYRTVRIKKINDLQKKIPGEPPYFILLLELVMTR